MKNFKKAFKNVVKKINSQLTFGKGLYTYDSHNDPINFCWDFINGWESARPENVKAIISKCLENNKKFYWCDVCFNNNYDGYGNGADIPVNIPNEPISGLNVEEIYQLFQISMKNLNDYVFSDSEND